MISTKKNVAIATTPVAVTTRDWTILKEPSELRVTTKALAPPPAPCSENCDRGTPPCVRHHVGWRNWRPRLRRSQNQGRRHLARSRQPSRLPLPSDLDGIHNQANDQTHNHEVKHHLNRDKNSGALTSWP